MTSIYLGEKTGSFNSGDNGFVNGTISVTEERYDKCSIFNIRKYIIYYPGLLESNFQTTTLEGYDLRIYTGYSNPINRFDMRAEYKYYYFPLNVNDIVKQVDSYYNILDDDLPFALVFTTRGGIKKFCKFDELNPTSNSRELPGIQIQDTNLCENLIRACKTGCGIFKFTTTTGENHNVDTKPQDIGTGIKFKKAIFTPSSSVRNGQLPLSIANLFTFRPKGNLTNALGDSFPLKVINQTFQAVKVYYTDSGDSPGDLAILIEFVKDCHTTHIMRITDDPPRWIEQEIYYDNDEELIDRLNRIKEVINTAITYELEKNSDSQVYSSGRVIITEHDQTHNSLYKIYKHNPIGQNREKAPILSYNGKTIDLVHSSQIKEKDALKPRDEDIFTEIRTYSLPTSPAEHLLIRLTKDLSFNYYLHRFSKTGDKWRQVGLDCLECAGINILSVSDMDLSQQLEKLLDDDESQSNVETLLNHISLSINSIIILLDKKLPYGKLEVNSLITTEIPPIDIESNSIGVTYDDVSSPKCLKFEDYKVCKHDITGAVRGKKRSDGNNLYLRFYLDGNLIRLYDRSDRTHSPLEYKDNINDLYVYYYGDEDPRPLLLCYSGSAYIPLSLNYNHWVRQDKISKYLCEDTSGSQELLDVLFEVGFLNVVRLKRRTEGSEHENKEPDTDGNHDFSYPMQKFNGRNISIRLTYRNNKCYRVYTHEHDGTGHNGEWFRLGNIYHGESSLKYNLKKHLAKVKVYYSVYDQDLKYPFLVILEFKASNGPDVEYYKLKGKDSTNWVKMEGYKDEDILKKLQNNEKIEDALYDLRENLGVKFDDKEKTLFKPDKCKEDDINVTLVAGTVVGTAAGVATVASVGVLVSKNIAATAAAAAAATAAAL